MKKIVLLSVVLFMLAGYFCNASADIRVTVNGEEIAFDTPPVLREGRTLVPLRAVVEKIGGKVGWDGETKTAELALGENVIRLTAGSKRACLNGEEKELDCEPVIENNRTLFPLRFIAESFGFNVGWNEEEKTVTVNTAARLLYQGQGSVRVITREGKVIYVDPYAGDGYDLEADLILVTHGHMDHNALEKIERRSADCVIITRNEALQGGVHQKFDLGFVNVEAVEAGNNKNHNITECVGYVLSLTDGKKIYLSGDTSTTEQMKEMSKMEIDYAFYCCDGRFNMDVEEAAACAALVGAKHNIPYHTGGKAPKSFDMEVAEKFNAPNRLIIDQGEEIGLN